MDITNFFGDVEVVEQQTEIKPGRYNLEYVNTNEELKSGKNGWMGMQLNFKVQGTGVFAPLTVTVAHDNPKNVNWGREELAKLAKAAGIEGGIKDTDDFKGTVVSVSLKLNENGYPEIDSKFGNSWKPAEQITETPKVVKQEAPKEESNETDEIPF
jgi:hypothetical protein